MRHTEGPWKIYPRPDIGRFVINGDHRLVRGYFTTPLVAECYTKANAALIAAAPEMHSLLVETLQTLNTALEAGELTDGLFLARNDLQALLARLEEK